MGSGVTSGECSEQNTFNISEERVSRWMYTHRDTVIVTIVVPLIWCLGVLTNLTFLFVMFRVPKIRSDTEVYLGHLALADLLYLSLSGTYYVLVYATSAVAFNEPFQNSAGCIGLFTVTSGGFFAAIGLVTMVSFERYLSLCHPIKHRKVSSRPRTYRIVGICWLGGFAVSGATVTRSALLKVYCLRWPDSDAYRGFSTTLSLCSAIQPWVPYYTTPMINIPWLTAMVANVYMYVRIIRSLDKRRRIGGRAEGDTAALKIRNQVAKMLVVNGVAFFLCQAPFRIMTLSGWVCSLAQIPDPIAAALESGARWMALIPQYINATVNPLIYGAMNAQYRDALVQAFRRNGQSRKRGPVNPPLAISLPVDRNVPARHPTSHDTDGTRL